MIFDRARGGAVSFAPPRVSPKRPPNAPPPPPLADCHALFDGSRVVFPSRSRSLLRYAHVRVNASRMRYVFTLDRGKSMANKNARAPLYTSGYLPRTPPLGTSVSFGTQLGRGGSETFFQNDTSPHGPPLPPTAANLEVV